MTPAQHLALVAAIIMKPHGITTIAHQHALAEAKLLIQAAEQATKRKGTR